MEGVGVVEKLCVPDSVPVMQGEADREAHVEAEMETLVVADWLL